MEGQRLVRERSEKYVTVHTLKKYSNGLRWSKPDNDEQKQRGRSIESVLLPPTNDGYDNGAKEILDDCKRFLLDEEFYNDQGTPHRRGYLLHGVPGSGKSSLVMALASELQVPIYWLQLSAEGLSDETLVQQLQAIRARPCVLLLEDVDRSHKAAREEDLNKELFEHETAVSTQTSQDNNTSNGMLTTSGLLNAVDGPGAPTGILLFMTTNNLHKLDKALIRSGRIDVRVEFKYVDDEQVKRLVRRFYGFVYKGRSEQEHVEQISSCISQAIIHVGEKLTAADIHGYLFRYKEVPYQAWKNVGELGGTKAKLWNMLCSEVVSPQKCTCIGSLSL